MASLALAFDILARDKASATLKNVGDQADKTGSRLAGLGTVAKGVGMAFAGVAAGGVVAFGAALSTGIKDAVSFQTLALKTEAVLKSTGNAAGTSVGGIQKLAGSLESLSGVDEELIINSQNVLATFTKIQNTGDDKIFDQATKSALNLSVALGQDLQGATTLVGKALNDPIKGLTALSKAGVGFTNQQKDQIKWMVASGDTLGAQKIILGELETQFGGTAEAAGKGLAGDLARLKDAFGDAFRELGTAVLPALTKFAQFLSGKLPKAIAFGQRAMKVLGEFWYTLTSGFTQDEGTAVEGWALKVRSAFGVLADVFGRVSGVFKEFWYTVTTGFTQDEGTSVEMWALAARDGLGVMSDVLRDRLIPAVKAIAGFLKDDFVPTLVDLGKWVISNKPVLIGLSVAVGVGLTGAFLSWAAAAAAAAASTVAATLPVLAIGAAIAGLTAGVIYAYQEWGWFRTAVDTVARFLTGTVWPAIQAGARWFRDDLVPAVQGAIEWFGNMIDKADEMGTRIGDTVEGIVSFFTGLPGRLASAAGDVFGFLTQAFTNAINFIINAWNSLDFTVPSFEVFGKTVGGFTVGLNDLNPISTGSGGRPAGLRPGLTMHTGGTVTPWGVKPLRSDEVMAKLQVGETVLPRGSAGMSGPAIHIESVVQNYPEKELPSEGLLRLGRKGAALMGA